MINNKELESISLSATKKDFYQIWNELLDTAKKLSERWDPTSTNESDPGIVLLKVLTAIADKLNYQIDKNTLEAFMPSAAQEESMRKLCDMLGYSMRYYWSATTDVTITYNGDEDISEKEILIPRYTNIKNNDDDVNYFTLNNIVIGGEVKSQSASCMEGEVVYCASDTDNIVTINQLTDTYKYYLPEAQIAENGIFISNVNDSKESDLWEKVDNLNTQEVGKLCFKFGFDSLMGMPFVQFPDDISSIIEDGLIIRYVRTSGASGNISYNTLSKLEEPEIWSQIIDSYSEYEGILIVDNFKVKNPSAATNGRNKESLNDAYNNYKKTIGTFDTLVTCRDYINKIYQLTVSDTNLTPLVSNIIVSDIRDDINRAITICTFNDYGIAYVDKSLKVTNTDGSTSDAISHFDLMLYPFTTVTGLNSKDEYKKSFKFDARNSSEIASELEKYKTISHNFVYPEKDELVCIKNYLRLNMKITTTSKVNAVEEESILNNIYTAIYENFNSRQLDFGDEIPEATIIEVIQNADTRIKNVNQGDSYLYTKFCLASGEEYDNISATTSSGEANPGFEYYNKLALRNILAGRIEMFDYNTNFEPTFSEAKYEGFSESYGKTSEQYISCIESNFKIHACDEAITLNENEVLQFRLPNLKTTRTHAAYTNYYLHLERDPQSIKSGIPATFQTLNDYLKGTFDGENKFNKTEATSFKNVLLVNNSVRIELKEIKTFTDFDREEKLYGALFIKDDQNIYQVATKPASESALEAVYYAAALNENTYGIWYRWIKDQDAAYTESAVIAKLKGIYRSLGSDATRTVGKMIDSSLTKYTDCYSYISNAKPLFAHYVQLTHSAEDQNWTKDGLGRDGEFEGIKANSEYKLQPNEYLLINYTPASSSESETSSELPVNIIYTPGTIIRPNFDLLDSVIYRRNGHSYTKTSGFQFSITVDGLFTLGTNEQIEIRDSTTVVLNDSVVYIYWERQDENSLEKSGDNILFAFDEDMDTATGKYTSYTLKDGEYIYYTDAAKLDLAYYGNGTKITRSKNTPQLYKKQVNSSTLADEIANNGLLAALNWEEYNLSGTNQALSLQEYQYVNLTCGDTLEKFNPSEELRIGDDINSNHWIVCKSAEYKLSSNTSTTTLPLVAIDDNTNWWARTILNFNMSPKIMQQLHMSYISNTSKSKTEDIITLKYMKNGVKPEEKALPNIDLKPSSNTKPLALKSNYLKQASTNKLDTHIYTYDTDGNIDKEINDFTVKVFEYKEVKSKEYRDQSAIVHPAKVLNLNNYGNGSWTKVSFDEYKEFELLVTLPNNSAGLIMFYYIDVADADGTTPKNQLAYLQADGTTPQIINYTDGESEAKTWWKGYYDYDGTTQKYHFRSAINVVRLNSSCTLTIGADTKQQGTLVFSKLNIVNCDTNTMELLINPRIAYNKIDKPTAMQKLMEDIKAVDPKYNFYYNAIIDSSIAIDLNTNITTTEENAELLSSPATWYDYNNINNKFVINEIDADELRKGIILTNSSRK